MVLSSLKKVENSIFDFLFLKDRGEILSWAKSQIQMLKMLEIKSPEEVMLNEYLTYYISLKSSSLKKTHFSKEFVDLVNFAGKLRDGSSDYFMVNSYEEFLLKPGTKYPFVLKYRKNLSLTQLFASLNDAVFDYKIFCLEKTLKIAKNGPQRILDLRAAWLHIQLLPASPFLKYGYNPLLDYLQLSDIFGVSGPHLLKPFLDGKSACTVLDYFKATSEFGHSAFVEELYAKLEPLFTDFYPLIHNPKATLVDFMRLCDKTRHLLDMDLSMHSNLLSQLKSDDPVASLYWNLLLNKDFIDPIFNKEIAEDFSQNTLDLMWTYLFKSECPYMTCDLFYRSRLAIMNESLFSFKEIGLSCDYRWMCLPEFVCESFDDKYRPAFRNGREIGIKSNLLHPCGVFQSKMLSGAELVAWLFLEMGDHLGSTSWSRSLKPSLDPILEDIIRVTDEHLNFNDDINFRVSFNENRASFAIVSGYPHHKRLTDCIKN